MKVRWGRLLVVPVALAFVVVGGCVASGGRDVASESTDVVVVPPSPSPSPPVSAARLGGPVVGVVSYESATTELARLDPKTLRPAAGGARLKLEGSQPMLAVAPVRSTAVFGSEVGELTVVDLVSLRRLGTVQTDVLGPAVFGGSWVGLSRLLVIGSPREGVTEVLAVDVRARRVVGRQRVDGVVQGSAGLPHGQALLVSPANAIAPARLVVSDADANLRTVTLADVKAGFRQLEETGDSEPRIEQAIPGIAADPSGRHVYVVPADGPVAEVDVSTLTVAYHRLGRSESPLQRLARWWAPPAEAKISSGPARTALWLGDGQLVITGYDGSAEGHHRQIPSGLQLIDTATWTARRVDRHSDSAMLAAGRLLGFGTAFGTGPNEANQGHGLTLYGPGNHQPVHLFGTKEVSWIQINGDLAYVHLTDADLSDADSYAVLDLRSGRVLHHSTGIAPDLLVPDRR